MHIFYPGGSIPLSPAADSLQALIWLAALAVLFSALVRVFLWRKMGGKGWEALIPFYSRYFELDKIWSRDIFWCWFIISILIPGVFLTISPFFPDWLTGSVCFLCALYTTAIWIGRNHKLSQAFGCGFGFTAGLLFLPLLFRALLVFGPYRFRQAEPVRETGSDIFTVSADYAESEVNYPSSKLRQ